MMSMLDVDALLKVVHPQAASDPCPLAGVRRKGRRKRPQARKTTGTPMRFGESSRRRGARQCVGADRSMNLPHGREASTASSG